MVSTLPTVTVGMPVHDDPAGLRRSVPTVFGQTWGGDVRLLVIDDGSGQETREVLESLSEVYGGIDVIRNLENRGRPRARNQILDHAGDGYLAWLDAGDLWHPRKLELQLAAIEAERAHGDEPLLCTTPLRRHFYDRGSESFKTPAIAGDQLYNALTGTLYPYLQTMLGEARVFREFGGFDERLLRRQDYDFLVRFVARGGRVISTADDLPLVTYLKSDVGASPSTVAAVNQVIRREHAPHYRRYGRGLARRIRRNQHLLVARFYGNNQRPVRAAGYRMLARLADPIVEWERGRGAVLIAWERGRGALRRAMGPLRSILRAAVRLASRGLRPLMPILRRTGVTSLARRLGIVRLLASLGLMRIFYRELGVDGFEATGTAAGDRSGQQGQPDRARPSRALAAARRAAERAIRTGDHDTAIDELETVLADDEGVPQLWLLLEKAYRQAGRFHSAQDALERALDHHQHDRRLEVRLIELLGLRREWAAAVKRWFDVRADGGEVLTPVAYARVARSLRMLDDPARALEIAEEGLKRWPDDQRLDDEFHRNRALVVDWSAAMLVSRSTISTPDDPEPVGTVTDAGFMAGGDAPIEGWVRARSDRPARVSLLLNDRLLASTYATPLSGSEDQQAARFSLNCRALLEYVGDGDVVTVTSDRGPIAILEQGIRWIVAPGFPTRTEVLESKLDQGHVFTKFGNLSLGYTPARKREILALFDDIADVIEREFGYPVFPLYGDLLGAVREHDFIDHDVGGFDVGYVSRHEEPAAVRDEVLRIASALVRHGFHLALNPWSVYVRRGRGDAPLVDLNFCWFNPAGELNLSYGWRYEPVTDRSHLSLHRECPIAGHLVRIPGNAEAVLEQLYGAAWAIPIQGFDPGAGITRDPAYLLTEVELTRLAAAHPDSINVMRVAAEDVADQSA